MWARICTGEAAQRRQIRPKVIGRAFEGAAGSIGNGGQRVGAAISPFLIHTGNYNAFLPWSIGLLESGSPALKCICS